jgi:hypothetical protein
MATKKSVNNAVEKIVEDIAIVDKLQPDQVTQFSELALKFLQTGANPKMYKSAAKHIGASVEEVGRCIMGISKLLINAVRRRLVSKVSFAAFAQRIGVPEPAVEPMAAFFVQNREAVVQCVGELSMQLPRYQNLDWRLDVEVSRRMAHDVYEPNFMFKLDTIDTEEQSQYMQVRFWVCGCVRVCVCVRVYAVGLHGRRRLCVSVGVRACVVGACVGACDCPPRVHADGVLVECGRLPCGRVLSAQRVARLWRRWI